MKPGDPLSQIDMLDTQKRLYDLGIFSQVDTAVQNPKGDEPEKNVLVQMCRKPSATPSTTALDWNSRPASPAGDTNQPQGETGVSPRVSFGVTRLNFRGRNHTHHLQGRRGPPAAARSGQL